LIKVSRYHLDPYADDAFLTSSLLLKQPMGDLPYRILSIASTDDLSTIFSPWIMGKMDSSDQDILESSHWLMTFGDDCMFRFWRLEMKDTLEWKELTQFSLYTDVDQHDRLPDPNNLLVFKTDPFGKMLTGKYLLLPNKKWKNSPLCTIEFLFGETQPLDWK
jgi:hypothetical protein